MILHLKYLALIFLVISIPHISSAEVVTADSIPWSGYWWPLRLGGLATGADYRRSPAPLEKYDLLTRGRYPAYLSTWYKNTYYDPSAPGWYGHCLSWSKAAITERYPILPSTEDNIHFRVGDKKGLLTIAHTRDPLELGNSSASTFHYWLLSYIKEKGQPFIADLDHGPEKWYYPIYEYDMRSTVRNNIESVTVTIHYISDDVHPDFIGSNALFHSYTYELTLDGVGSITGGEWTGSSVDDHPDLLVFPLSQQTDAVDFDYRRVRAIAGNQDDSFENGAAQSILPPGTHNLVLLNEDKYQINLQLHDSFTLTIEKLSGSRKTLSVALEDSGGNMLSHELTRRGNISWAFSDVDNPPYTLTLSQNGYDDPNLYTVILDQQTDFNLNIPYVPKNGMWMGFAVTNASDSIVKNVTLTSYGMNGNPIQTLWGPITLAAGQKRVFLSTALPYRKHEFSKTSMLALSAGSDVGFVNLFGSGTKILVSEMSSSTDTDHIVLVQTLEKNGSGKVLVGSLRNQSLHENDVVFKIYSEHGSLEDQFSITLTGHETLQIKPGYPPFNKLKKDGWIDIHSSNGLPVNGFLYLNSTHSAEGIFGLSADNNPDGGQYIPHIPATGHWVTTVTLINLTASKNPIRLHSSLAGSDHSGDLVVTLDANEKRTVEIGDLFGRLPGDPLYHTIVGVTAPSDFVGYFSYQDGSSGDRASLPLLNSSHFKNKLILAHTPDNSNWWTGVAVANPLSISQKVVVAGYDTTGQPIAEATREIMISPNSYQAFTVSSIFTSLSSEISYISFDTENSAGYIGGLFLYGSPGRPCLSGGIM